jgi:drug/metabolite transporter (DMT)-like permease
VAIQTTDSTRFGLPQGVVTIVATVFAMALTDAIIKLSSSEMTLWQIWILRSAIVVPILLVATKGRVCPPGTGWIIARGVALVVQYLCYYAVLPLIDMALAGAAAYIAPFFIVGLSALVLGNRITLRHWLAIATGFAGLLLIVQPFAAAFTPLVFLPIAAALFYAIAAILTRVKCAETPALILALWLNITCLAFGLAIGAVRGVIVTPEWAGFIFGPWHSMAGGDWGMILVLSVLIIGIAIGLARAYQSPRPEVIATFDYSYMIFVVFWGYVFFGEVPDLWTLAGMALISAGGLGVLMIRDSGPRRP